MPKLLQNLRPPSVPYAKAFPFSRVVDGMLDPEMIDGAARILNEATKNRFQVNIIISNQIGGNAS